MDDFKLRMAEILGTDDLEVTPENLDTFRSYLIKNLKGSVLLKGIEDFPWEERFVFGGGSEKEYKELRKTRPSYEDTFKLLKILPADEIEGDLLAKVSRKSDLKRFQIRLSELECTDENSPNYELLDDFSVWVVNY